MTPEQQKQFEKDSRTVVNFIVGWWPGLEDGIRGWGDEETLDNQPVFVAAKRMQALLYK